MVKTILTLIIYFLILFPSFVSAQTECPKFIASMESGVYSKSIGNYLCFSRKRDVESFGFISSADGGVNAQAEVNQNLPVTELVEYKGTKDSITKQFVVSDTPAELSYRFYGTTYLRVYLINATTGAKRLFLSIRGRVPNWENSFVNEPGTYYLHIAVDLRNRSEWRVNVETTN